ncbi:hypothetical protein [Legionella longbeachae]|uniref:hypothetical protein n=1 Tax=Legionella longbeachae TaxID=450 RepID=UPI001C1A4BF4|nr:hypothetical protein [Legionella pneumophila]
MNEWEIKSTQRQLNRLEETVSKQSTTNFIWLIILSNILFWFCIAHIGLKHDMNMVKNLLQQHQTGLEAEQNVKANQNPLKHK